MRKLFATILFGLVSMLSAAQDARPFDATVSNDEYKIYIRMNFYDRDVAVPGQDVLGRLDGYIGSSQSINKWMIVSSRLINKTSAEIEVTNDYGSEDFTAVIKAHADGTYSFRKKGGSTLKFGVKRKWQKLPSAFILKRK